MMKRVGLLILLLFLVAVDPTEVFAQELNGELKEIRLEVREQPEGKMPEELTFLFVYEDGEEKRITGGEFLKGQWSMDNSPLVEGQRYIIFNKGSETLKVPVTVVGDSEESTGLFVDPPRGGDEVITGLAPAGAHLKVVDGPGKLLAEGHSDENGRYRLSLSRKLQGKEELRVFSDDMEVKVTVAEAQSIRQRMAYVRGGTDHLMDPNAVITRWEAAVLLARLSEGKMELPKNEKTGFKDSGKMWYNSYINVVVKKGFMKGYPDNTFRPGKEITRGEFAAILSRGDKKNKKGHPFSDLKGHWAEDYIAQEYNNGRIEGYPNGTFRPNAKLTRAEAIAMFNRLFDRKTDGESFRHTEHMEKLNSFADVHPSHWFYYDILDAANNHETTPRKDGKELWTRVLD
ncbi:MAG: S-layer homology domain-containing protein [Tissierellia bacterium]|nr:S-layer homology domain-containing protein [Tissierellia bacterium]